MGELINGRTPDEIKTWMEYCASHQCPDCPYDKSFCSSNMVIDAGRFLIAQLEAERDAALAKVPKWISVEERLPEPEQRVLLLTEEKQVTRYTKWRGVTCGFYEDGNVWSEDSKASWDHCMLVDYDEERDDFRVPEGWIEEGIAERDDYNCTVISDKITHWMPLPEPPEEQKEI